MLQTQRSGIAVLHLRKELDLVCVVLWAAAAEVSIGRDRDSSFR